MVYNFGRVCLYVCLLDNNLRKPRHTKFIFAHLVYLPGIRVKLMYEGHRVKVKVKGKRQNVENSYFHNVKQT